MKLTAEQSLLELTLLNAEAAAASFEDFFVAGVHAGLPPALLTRLKQLWEQTKVIGGELVAVGKIIVQRIFEFVLANPKLAIGLAIGVVVGHLVAGIPLIGPLLAPVSLVLVALYGAGVGAAMEKGDYSGSPYTAAIELVDKFFELLRAVFNGIAQYWNADGHGQVAAA